MTEQADRSIDAQWQEFKQRSFITMPIAGAIAWAAIGVCGLLFESTFYRCMSIFAGTGMIFYLALLLSRFTGEGSVGEASATKSV